MEGRRELLRAKKGRAVRGERGGGVRRPQGATGGGCARCFASAAHRARQVRSQGAQCDPQPTELFFSNGDPPLRSALRQEESVCDAAQCTGEAYRNVQPQTKRVRGSSPCRRRRGGGAFRTSFTEKEMGDLFASFFLIRRTSALALAAAERIEMSSNIFLLCILLGLLFTGDARRKLNEGFHSIESYRLEAAQLARRCGYSQMGDSLLSVCACRAARCSPGRRPTASFLFQSVFKTCHGHRVRQRRHNTVE